MCSAKQSSFCCPNWYKGCIHLWEPVVHIYLCLIWKPLQTRKYVSNLSVKYLGAVVSDDGSKPEVLSRTAQATAALTKLKSIWRDNNISLGSKVKLMCSLVISIFLYACESWTLTAELESRTQAFEMRCYPRLLKIP